MLLKSLQQVRYLKFWCRRQTFLLYQAKWSTALLQESVVQGREARTSLHIQFLVCLKPSTMNLFQVPDIWVSFFLALQKQHNCTWYCLQSASSLCATVGYQNPTVTQHHPTLCLHTELANAIILTFSLEFLLSWSPLPVLLLGHLTLTLPVSSVRWCPHPPHLSAQPVCTSDWSESTPVS